MSPGPDYTPERPLGGGANMLSDLSSVRPAKAAIRLLDADRRADLGRREEVDEHRSVHLPRNATLET
jgi:hypothetical protein